MDKSHDSPGGFKPDVTTICCECGSEYALGDADAALLHADNHARWEAEQRQTCECGLPLVDDDPDHEAFHERWCTATSALGYWPVAIQGTSGHERLKDAARRLIADGRSNEELVAAAVQLLRCFFDRSLYRSIDRDDWRQHPGFAEYVGMADLEALIGRAASATRAKYPAVPPTGVLDGGTYWIPFGLAAMLAA